MRSVLLLFVIMSICLHTASAQEASSSGETDVEEESEVETPHQLIPGAELETTRDYQSEDFVVRKFDEDKWKEVVKGVDYREEEELLESRQRTIPAFSWDSDTVRIVAYVIAILAVLVLLYFAIKNLPLDLKVRQTAVASEDLENGIDNIESLDTRALLENAIREKNFRLAVRLYYLCLLKELHEKRFINWKKDKTNRDYLSELFLRNFLFDEVRRLTLSYETVWYGDHDVRPGSFEALSARFETVLEKISNTTQQ